MLTTPDYDTDFYAWTQQQAEALRAHDGAALDIEHLVEELEELLEESRARMEAESQCRFARQNTRARRKASRETRLSLATFPEACPWTIEQVLDTDFWPEDHRP